MTRVTRMTPFAGALSCGSLLLLLGATACARATTQSSAPGARVASARETGGAGAAASAAAPDTVAYRAMRRRLAGLATVPGSVDSVRAMDMAAIRRAFAASSDYAPYGADTDLRQAMFDALDRSAFAEARRMADSALAANYLDIFAHVGAGMAARGLGDARADEFHQAMIGALFTAILSSGEGTRESPWVVLSIDEEYALLQMRGLRRTTQALGECANGRACDILTVVGKDGVERNLWFDVGTPKAWLMRSFEAR